MNATPRFSIMLRNAGIALLLAGFLGIFGCGEEKTTAPPPPKVVKKTIAVKKPAATAKATPGKSTAASAPKQATKPKSTAPKTASASKPSTQPAAKAVAAGTAAKAMPAAKTTATDAKASASPGTEGQDMQEEASVETLLATFSYSAGDRADPFLPLFTAQPAVKEEKEGAEAKGGKEGEGKPEKKKRIPRTPLEKVDLSQLKLVAIVRAESGNRALVQDATGKGYVLNRGTYIGIHSGIVKEIQKDKVIVEEEVEDIYGKESLREREMVLQKPLGEL